MKAKDLKNAILQMAVQGTLVPQDPSDEPSSALLERIREERAELIREKKIKAPKGGESVIYRAEDGSYYEKRIDAKGRESEPVCIDEEIPFEIPETWEWARLGNLCDFGTCINIEYTDVIPGTWNLDLEDIERDTGKYLRKKRKVRGEKGSTKHVFKCGMVLYSKLRPYLNKVIIADEDGVCTSEILPLSFESLLPKYAQVYFMSPMFLEYANACSYGVKMPRLGTKDGKAALAPVPPLAEQHRIVERVAELMPLVEEYGKFEDAREKLDAELPDRLRKSVLRMAVQGALVPQDPSDEPASALLERIREQRAELVRERKIKAPKGGESVIYRAEDGSYCEKRIDAKGRESEPVCIDDEIPFDIPETWEWVRLCDLASFAGGKTPATNDKSNYADNGILWVTSKDMKRDYIDSTLITLSEKGASDLTIFSPGTIIMVTRSGILRRMLPVAILKAHATINQDQKAICPFDASISIWLLVFLKASDVYIRQNFSKAGTTVESIVFDKVKTQPIPVPPLAEQHRIVERVAELMPLIEGFGKLDSYHN